MKTLLKSRSCDEPLEALLAVPEVMYTLPESVKL
jgi:hypothetical protein